MTEPTREEVIKTLREIHTTLDRVFGAEDMETWTSAAADMLEEQQALINLALQYIDNNCASCGGTGISDEAYPGTITYNGDYKCQDCKGTGFKSPKLAALIKKYQEG